MLRKASVVDQVGKAFQADLAPADVSVPVKASPSSPLLSLR